MANNTSANYLTLHQILQHHGMKAEGTVLTEDERALALQLVEDNKLMLPRDEPNEPIIHEKFEQLSRYYFVMDFGTSAERFKRSDETLEASHDNAKRVREDVGCAIAPVVKVKQETHPSADVIKPMLKNMKSTISKLTSCNSSLVLTSAKFASSTSECDDDKSDFLKSSQKLVEGALCDVMKAKCVLETLKVSDSADEPLGKADEAVKKACLCAECIMDTNRKLRLLSIT
jgi:hypothetical protein